VVLVSRGVVLGSAFSYSALRFNALLDYWFEATITDENGYDFTVAKGVVSVNPQI
jgi:hypothetical protein